MDELIPWASSFLRENLLAVICFGIGLIFLVYGVIVFSSFGEKKSDVVFEASAVDQDQDRDKKDSSGSKMIVVDIAGAVNKPGVYRLDTKSRIEDALLAAGGISSEADQSYIAKNVNLASVLTDGTKIYIPFVGEQQVLGTTPLRSSSYEGQASQGAQRINLNTASSSQFEALPGIGVVTAGKIISARPYSSVEELVKKKIVSQKVFDQIKEKVSVY